MIRKGVSPLPPFLGMDWTPPRAGIPPHIEGWIKLLESGRKDESEDDV